jgi:hypothetical protein
MKTTIVPILMFVVLVVVASPGAAQSPEQKLSTLNGRPTVSAVEFSKQMNDILRKTKTTTRDHLADIAVYSLQLMKESGRTETLFAVVRAINTAIPERFAHQIDVDRVSTALVVMSKSADFRNEALGEVAISLNALLSRQPTFLDSLGR